MPSPFAQKTNNFQTVNAEKFSDNPYQQIKKSWYMLRWSALRIFCKFAGFDIPDVTIFYQTCIYAFDKNSQLFFYCFRIRRSNSVALLVYHRIDYLIINSAQLLAEVRKFSELLFDEPIFMEESLTSKIFRNTAFIKILATCSVIPQLSASRLHAKTENGPRFYMYIYLPNSIIRHSSRNDTYNVSFFTVSYTQIKAN